MPLIVFLNSEKRALTGRLLIDEEILREYGITDFNEISLC